MDVVERLTLEAAQADTLIAREHRHRYELAARLCRGLRVLDLCCGSGYGCAILAGSAERVVGVDRDAASVEHAGVTVAREHGNVAFEIADALAYLRGELAPRFDAIVCFEGLEHLADLDGALSELHRHAQAGVRLVVSVPNTRTLHQPNEFHLSDFGFDEAVDAFAGFPRTLMATQFLAEGSLIRPPGADGQQLAASLTDPGEPDYANHFIFCVGFEERELGEAHADMALTVAPLFNRWSEGIKEAMGALRRENARLARGRLGKAGSAAASALLRLKTVEAELSAIRERCAAAEARVAELEALLGERGAAAGENAPLGGSGAVAAGVADGARARVLLAAPPLDPSQRERIAAEALVPWIEQTIPLADRSVLLYRGADRTLAGALAGVGAALSEVQERGPALAALSERRGEIDVLVIDSALHRLKLEERLQLLALAAESVGGAVVVLGEPNRLVYWDGPAPAFSLMLPEGLAAADQPPGISFHEFERALGDLGPRVLACGYDPLLLAARPVRAEEIVLARRLEALRPDLAPAWSRARLDVILSPRPLERRPPFLRPWTVDTTGAAAAGWTAGEELRLLDGGTVRIGLPRPVRSLTVGVIARHERPLALTLAADGAAPALGHHPGPPGVPVYLRFELGAPAQHLKLGADQECRVPFIGYES